MTLFNRLRAVLLVLVLLPLLTVATPPRPASAQAIPRYVQLVSLTAYVTEDWVGADEPYLNVGGVRVWSGSLSDGWSANLTHLPAKQIYDRVNIALYDDDDWPDSDDLLGSGTAFASQAGLGYRTFTFDGPGWYYQLTYYVY